MDEVLTFLSSLVFFLVLFGVVGVIIEVMRNRNKLREQEPEEPPSPWLAHYRPASEAQLRAMNRYQVRPDVQAKIAEHGRERCFKYTVSEEQALVELERRQRARGEVVDSTAQVVE